jgi:Zn-dependent M28 family amino/carboxypeptidase
MYGLLFITGFVIILIIITRPLIKIRNTKSTSGKLPEPHNPEITHNLHRHVEVLCNEIGSRSVYEYEKIVQAKQYLEFCLLKLEVPYVLQEFMRKDKAFANIIVTLNGTNKSPETIVIGAHYDTVFNTPGADDNASAISVLLEMCRILKGYSPGKTIKLVFFTLEEPPAFNTQYMGSYIFARDAKKRGEKIHLMIALEMLGYFSEDKNKQEFPFLLMRLFYPTTPNFILVVGNLASKHLVKLTGDKLNKVCDLQVETLTVPSFFPGVGLSDNGSFWKMGFNAIMITDTAIYRNPNYHTTHDSIDTLDFNKMTSLCEGLVEAIKELSE